MTRPSWDTYFLDVAQAVANRADCTRRQVGAVIVDQEHRVISTGYNGAPAGQPGCATDGACPRGAHHQVPSVYRVKYCACGCEWPCKYSAAPGSSYDTGAGSCIAVHAEANCLLYARRSLVDCTMYVTDKPCDGCKRLIHAAKLADVVYRYESGDTWAYECETQVEYQRNG